MQKILLSEIKSIEAQVQSCGEYISLSQGALKVGGIPQEIKEHMQMVLASDATDYYESAWGIMPLRGRIAQHLSEKHSVALSHENIVVTHGCMGAISTLLLALLETGDEVLLPEPTYPAYKTSIPVAGGVPVFVPCPTLDCQNLEAVRTAKTKAVLFSNPCNPTGYMASHEELEAVIAWGERHGIYVIVDEAYDNYIFESGFCSATPYVPQSEFVIRTGSYSKSLSMSGWRVGYMVVPTTMTWIMGVTQDAILNCPNVFAQHAVLYALDHPECSEHFHVMVKEGRDEVVRGLQPLVDAGLISYEVPPAGFYLFFKTNHDDSFDLCMSLLHEAKVGLIPGRAFGPSAKPFLRLCYARKKEVLHEGLLRIRKFFNV